MNNTSTRWDASPGCRINKKLTIQVKGPNLTDEGSAWYAPNQGRPEDSTFTGAPFNGGVKFRC